MPGHPCLVNAYAGRAIALRLAEDAGWRQALRRRLAAKHQAPLFDIAHLTGAVERAYQTMAQRLAAGLPPAAFDVPEADA